MHLTTNREKKECHRKIFPEQMAEHLPPHGGTAPGAGDANVVE